MSKIEVDAIEPQSGTTLTLGASGDTITIPSGATLTNSGTATGFYSNSDALTLFNATGSAPVFACRAWVRFNGTGTVAIDASGNVTSITDNGTGFYDINFTTAMPDINYCIVGSSRNAGFAASITSTTTQSASAGFINTLDLAGNHLDVNRVFAAIFR